MAETEAVSDSAAEVDAEEEKNEQEMKELFE